MSSSQENNGNTVEPAIILIVAFPSRLVKVLQLLGPPLARGHLKEDRIIGCQAGRDLMPPLSTCRLKKKKGPQRLPTPT